MGLLAFQAYLKSHRRALRRLENAVSIARQRHAIRSDSRTVISDRCDGVQKMEPLTISVSEAARVIGLGKTRTWALISSGELAAVKLGRRTLVRTDSLRALVGVASR